MGTQPSATLLTRLTFDAKRIMHGGIACQRCNKWLTLPPDMTNAEAREELRDEGWRDEGAGWSCNECSDTA